MPDRERAQVQPGLLLSHESLDVCRDEFTGGELQERFDAGHARSVENARTRLANQLTVSLESGPGELETGLNDAALVGRFVGAASGLDAADAIVDRVTAAASALGQGAAVLAATEHVGPLTSASAQRQTPGVQLDSLRPERMWPLLDRGWQLRVANPHNVDPAIAALVHDLDLAHGVQRSLLVFGLRSALGAPPEARDHDRLIVQLDGMRSVFCEKDGDRTQRRMAAGQVLVVHAGIVVGHLPLDLDSLHLEVDLRGKDTAGSQTTSGRSAAALRVGKSNQTHETAREVVASDPDVGWPMRLLAPGGVQVMTTNETATDIVVAGHRLRLTASGVETLVALAQGDFIDPSAAASLAGCDPRAAVKMFEDLWEIGVLDAARPPSRTASAGSRLNQVASAMISEPQIRQSLLAAIDPTKWREADDAEVHHGPGVEVKVQPVGPEGPISLIAQLADIAASMNQQFFGVDVTQLDPADPPLLVQVRSGAPTDVGNTWMQHVSSDVSEAYADRKITFVFSLTEPGDASLDGWVSLAGGSPAIATGPGNLSAWLSMRPWALNSLRDGERVFLIGRLHGPPFR